MIENLTLGRSAAAALRRAAHGAELLSHTYTGTEHILMALLSERSAGSARIFALRSVDTITARRMLMRECAWTLSEEPDHESA